MEETKPKKKRNTGPRVIKNPRPITNEDIIKYEPMIEMWLRKSVVKNWREADVRKQFDEVSLGNSGMTMADFRQKLRMEVFIALQNYDSTKNTKESSFVWTHLYNRIGQTMKRLVLREHGYGVWTSDIQEVMHEIDRED